MARLINSAMPVPAEPAPRNRNGLVFPTLLEDAEGGRDAGHGHGSGALDVVVVAADPVAVAGQERHGMKIREVLELDATVREDFLHGHHELFEEGVVLVAPNPRLTQPEVERIGQQRFVVGTHIKSDGQRDLGRHAGAGGVERQLTDRDAHAVDTQVAQAEDALAVGDDREADIFLRPVAE